MNKLNKISFIILIIIFCFSFFAKPISLLADNGQNNVGQNEIAQSSGSSTSGSAISKDSDLYKIMVGLTILSLIIVVIAFRSMIFSLFAYFFMISSFVWTIYSAFLALSKKPFDTMDLLPVGAGIVLIIISFVLLHFVNGNHTFGSSMKADQQELPSSKNELDLILKRAKLAFMTVKKELSQGKLDKTSAFTSDELFEQININLDGMKAEKYLIVYDDLRIKKISVKKKAVENHFNNLYIEILAFGTRYKTNLETKKIMEGSEVTGEFSEIYCFSRKAGCKAATKGLVEGFCPRCGNPIKGNRSANCSKCNNELRTGEYDMVLTGISYPDNY